MTYETDLYAYLATHADAAALRSAIGAARIYWTRVPQPPTFPLVVIDTVDARPDYTLGGDNGLQNTTLQFSILAATAEACVTIREALRALLHGVSQLTAGATLFHSFTLRDFREFWTDDTPAGYVTMPVDVQMIHGSAP